MKKIFKITSTLLCALAVTSCTLFNFDSSDSSTSGGSTNTTTSTSEGPQLKEIKSTTFDDSGTYNVGYTYKVCNQIKIFVTYKDNTTEEATITKLDFLTSKDPNGDDFDASTPFKWAGKYKIKFYCTYSLKDERVFKVDKSSPELVEIKAKTLVGIKTPTSIEFKDALNLNVGDKLGNKLDTDLIYNFVVDGEPVQEYIHFDKTNAFYTIELYKNSSLVSDPLNHVLSSSSEYRLEITDTRYSVKVAHSFTTGSGYYRLNASDFALYSSDLDNAYAPAMGTVKILVIPITLSGSWTDTWTASRVSQLDGYYFGDDPLSLKNYYETASFGQMNVSGMVSEIYTETSDSLTTNTIMADTSYNKLFTLIERAVSYIENQHPDIDFSEYDLNDDGCLDNVHLITNFNTSTYESQTGNNPWATPLWPHKYQTGQSGTLSKPKANVYSISANNHVHDAITAIHEQGHIFGLNDYYDYGYTGVDYVGSADMQSSNMFDWNSYSKLTVGWVSPYVVSDECEITIGSASKTGDCLIIPANNSTFSRSAFDEYFLIELFTQDGNNAKFTDEYKSYCDFTGKYGVRLYHVDSRVFKYNGSFVESDDKSQTLYAPMDNDSYDYDGRSSYFNQFRDYKLLTLIQRGKTDTFGQEGSGYRHYLTTADLFKQGDVFTFGDYDHFLSKQHSAKTKMDNGETFPYQITFTAMSNDNVTIKIDRV